GAGADHDLRRAERAAGAVDQRRGGVLRVRVRALTRGGTSNNVMSGGTLLAHESGRPEASLPPSTREMLTLKSLRTRRTTDSTSGEAIPRCWEMWRRSSSQTRPRATAIQRVTVDWFTRYMAAIRAWLAPPTRFRRQTTRSRSVSTASAATSASSNSRR